jgi:hypothetical protein
MTQRIHHITIRDAVSALLRLLSGRPGRPHFQLAH